MFAVVLTMKASTTSTNPGRDFTPTYDADIRLKAEGDPCPHCGAPIAKARGIEAGQEF